MKMSANQIKHRALKCHRTIKSDIMRGWQADFTAAGMLGGMSAKWKNS
jgi:hypothetical protein